MIKKLSETRIYAVDSSDMINFFEHIRNALKDLPLPNISEFIKEINSAYDSDDIFLQLELTQRISDDLALRINGLFGAKYNAISGILTILINRSFLKVFKYSEKKWQRLLKLLKQLIDHELIHVKELSNVNINKLLNHAIQIGEPNKDLFNRHVEIAALAHTAYSELSEFLSNIEIKRLVKSTIQDPAKYKSNAYIFSMFLLKVKKERARRKFLEIIYAYANK